MTEFKSDVQNIDTSWTVGVTLTLASLSYSTRCQVDSASPL